VEVDTAEVGVHIQEVHDVLGVHEVLEDRLQLQEEGNLLVQGVRIPRGVQKGALGEGNPLVVQRVDNQAPLVVDTVAQDYTWLLSDNIRK